MQGIVDCLPVAAGSYALLLELGQRRRIQVGRRGSYEFKSGYYVYLGTAFGPGGLRARLGRHLRRDKVQRWHIDYLRPHCRIVGVWLSQGIRMECCWAEHLQGLPDVSHGAPRFGASDCRCQAHLFYLGKRAPVGVIQLPGEPLWVA